MNTRWNKNAALLGIPDLPEEAFKHVGDRKIKPQGGGGGGTSTGVTYTSNVPEYAQQPFMNMVGKAEALSGAQYQPYTGQRIEGFSPLQQQAQSAAANQTTSPQTTQAAGLAGLSSVASFTNPGTAGIYMSPFMQNVVDVQKREAMRDADIATQQRNAGAVSAGAFGGSRQAIMDAEAGRNLQTQLGDIQAKGLQSAFESGQSQFNNEMARMLQGAGTLGSLGQQLFGQQMDITQLRNNMGAQQQALGQKQLDQQYADFQAQRDYPYQQIGFLSDILRGAQGTSRTMYSSSPQMSPLQAIAGLGTTAAGLGAFSRGGAVRSYKSGGIVQAFAAGGAVAPAALPAQLRTMSDQALQQFMQQNREDIYSVALASSEANARKKLREAAAVQGAAPQGSVVDEAISEASPMMGGIAAAAPDMEFADGGIVGYADGGTTYPGLIRYGGSYGGDTVLPRETGYEGMGLMEFIRRTGGDLADWARSMGLTGTLAEKNAAWAKDGEKAVDTGDETYRLLSRYPAPGNPATPAATEGKAASPAAPVPASAGLGAFASARTGRGPTSPRPAGIDVAGLMAQGEKRLEGIGAAERAAAEAEGADLDAEIAARGKFGEKQEARIKGEQDGMGAKEEKAKNMALVQAGLSILSADPARGGLAAIGEGALKGLGAYKGDMAELDAKRAKLIDKLDAIDEMRRQEQMADSKDRRALRSKARQAEVQALRDGMELFSKVGVPATIENVKMTFDAWKSQQENDTRLAAARIGASAGSRNNMLEMTKAFAENPQLLATYQQMQAKDPSLTEQFNKYLQANPMAGMNPQQALMDFLRAQAALSATRNVRVSDTPTGQVLSR